MEWQYRLEEINNTATKVWELVKDNPVIVFDGEMGAGKTTLVQAICHSIGVNDKVSSPSFSIINEYLSPRGSVYHIDLYRCKSEEEAVRAGVEECIYSGSTCFVEWPSKAPGIFPPAVILISIEQVDEDTRKLSVNTVSLKDLAALSRL